MGAYSLSSALGANSTLKILRLWSNELTDKGEQALAQATQRNPQSALVILDITGTDEHPGDDDDVEDDDEDDDDDYDDDDDDDDDEDDDEDSGIDNGVASILAPPPLEVVSTVVDGNIPWASLSAEQLQQLLVEFKQLETGTS
jgi:hypothetical protein